MTVLTLTASMSNELKPIDLKLSKPTSWTAESWRSKSVHAQEVIYENKQALFKACQRLSSFPPLVHKHHIDEARDWFAEAARGKAFIIQGGDCAESFEDVQLDIIASKVSLLVAQAEKLESALQVPVVTIGRLAGQYAKPRSNPFEKLSDGTQIHSFRGHNVNGPALEDRKPDPSRLILGHLYSATTIKAIETVQAQKSTNSSAFSLDRSDSSSTLEDICKPTFFTSHEALHLPYETSQTSGRYNTSAAMLWIGERTRQLGGAHVEYMRGIKNPIGVKFGPSTTPQELIGVLDALCADKKSDVGKVTIITRLGADKVNKVLPKLIRAVQNSGHQPVWMVDPCHGNTFSANGIKTRCTSTLLKEILITYDIHRKLGSYLGGIHLEQTGESVKECVEQVVVGLDELSLGINYRTLCDPRLSREQALDLIDKFADHTHCHGVGLKEGDGTEFWPN